jgi:hypothetical protein
MIPLILGLAIGALLAVANFCASVALSSMAIRSSKTISIAVVLGSFFGRLLLLFLAFYFLSRVEIIHLPSTLVTFLVCFTILIFWEVKIYYRRAIFQGTDPPRASGTMRKR